MTHPTITDGRVVAQFDTFDLDAYRRFIAAKALPSRELTFDEHTGAYTVTAPARFAHLLDPALAPPAAAGLRLAPHLFDYQAWVVRRALDAKRFAAWMDTGLGKTAVFLEYARQVVAATGGRVLILSPLGIIGQTRAQADRFYAGTLPVDRLDTRTELEAWCTGSGPGVAICNYEKFIPGRIPDLSRLAGLVLDESSVLKTGGGKIKWNLIHSARGIEYKLSCTATPAPNEIMEYASQASFLETIRHEGEVMWTWFRRDKYGVWSIKPHGRPAFYRWMGSWSIYLRDPARFGWRDVLAELPDPVWREEQLPLAAAQRDAMLEVCGDADGSMFAERLGVRDRAKLAQIARGFVYEGTGPDRRIRRIDSVKPARVAAIVRAEVAAGRPTIVWCVFDAEAAIVRDLLDGLDVVTVDGTVPEADRGPLLARFADGHAQVLITKAQVGGYGLNLQHAKSMVFSGFDDSQERMYQAVRRAYRFGQTDVVHVFVPYVAELEGLMFTNIRQKEARFVAEVAAQEAEYLRVLESELTP